MGFRTIQNRKYSGIILGVAVRKQLAKTVIFRVRRGNGFFNSLPTVFYQDQYAYVVPSSITNVESAAYRTLFASAVSYWQNDLTPQEKAEYIARAARGLKMSGYNLFIKEVMLSIYKI